MFYVGYQYSSDVVKLSINFAPEFEGLSIFVGNISAHRQGN